MTSSANDDQSRNLLKLLRNRWGKGLFGRMDGVKKSTAVSGLIKKKSLFHSFSVKIAWILLFD